MVKRVVKYKDFDEVERTATLYFNLTKVECVDLDFEYESFGGLVGYMKSLISGADPKDPRSYDTVSKKPIWEFIKKLVLKSYGQKSEDGSSFIKSEAITNSFANSNVYGEFIFSLLDDKGSIADFVKGVMPEVDDDKFEKAKKDLAAQGLIPVDA